VNRSDPLRFESTRERGEVWNRSDLLAGPSVNRTPSEGSHAAMPDAPPEIEGRPFLSAEWRYLVLMNYRVDAALLAPWVPRGTVLDTWRGDTWVSIVGFRFLRTRVLGCPAPGHTNFPEINLRFYVRPETDDRRAVVFVREIVPRRLIAVVARATYNEPYVTRRMRVEAPKVPVEEPGTVSYSWFHQGRWNRFGVTALGSPRPIEVGSDEEFITEHYWGYTPQRDGGTVEYRVVHPRWRVWPVRDIVWDVDVAAEYGPAFGEALRGTPLTAFLAEGSEVQVGRPVRLERIARPATRA
jgi:uncharacterized protein YqjF (DUF2071 family)